MKFQKNIKKQTLGEIGEVALIHSLKKQLGSGSAIVGIGDDCAVLPHGKVGWYTLLASDPVVEGIHFSSGTAPRQVGWKALARNLSDIAAMGGFARWAVVSLGLRSDASVEYVQRLYEGMSSVAGQFGCEIVGGDTTQVRNEQFISVTISGEVEKTHLVTRAGSKVGDAVFVTGSLGGSLRGKHLKFMPRIDEARWLVDRFKVHSMIDVSDGLSCDLHRLIEGSHGKIGFEIYEVEIPIARSAKGSLEAALNDGEDFELLFTVPSMQAAELSIKWKKRFTTVLLTQIGRVVEKHGKIELITEDGKRSQLQSGGYEHFASH